MNVLSIILRLRDVQVGGCNFTRLTFFCALELDYRFWSRNRKKTLRFIMICRFGVQTFCLTSSFSTSWYFLTKQFSTGLAKLASITSPERTTAWLPTKDPFELHGISCCFQVHVSGCSFARRSKIIVGVARFFYLLSFFLRGNFSRVFLIQISTELLLDLQTYPP